MTTTAIRRHVRNTLLSGALKRPEFRLHPSAGSSFDTLRMRWSDRLRMRWSDFYGLDLMASLSRFGGLTARP
jgi:hypothetical protein